jgi:uracil-DNA glycosylase
VDELRELVGHLRRHLGRHARGGAWAAPGGRSPRVEVAVEVDDARAAEAGAGIVAAPFVEPAVEAPTRGGVRLTLADVRAELGDCQRCKLSQTRNKIVFGNGAPDAPLVFVGEAPGADEDRIGDPFVGRAGELLDKMIDAMGWSRQTVYVTNTLKCRPPGNRNPAPDETAACQPFLWAQLGCLAPRVVVALGRPAANLLLGRDAPISALRGKFHDARGVKVLPTFHPAYLLREPERKRDAWNDLKLVIAELDRLGITPPRAPRT